MPRIHINIGSNKGDRAALIERAVALIASRIDSAGNADIRLAPIIESEPWGYDSPHPYLNLGLMIDMPDDVMQTTPEGLLDELLKIEHEISAAPHRDPSGGYCDRQIDIDLIAVGDTVTDTARLTLPHPRMSLRPFVLEPVACLDPAWRHPLTGKTAAEMLAEIRH